MARRPGSRFVILLLTAIVLLAPGTTAAVVTSVSAPVARATQAAAPEGSRATVSHAPPELYEAILPGLREAIIAETAHELSVYRLNVQLDPDARTIGGRLLLTFVNRFDRPLDDVAFRLYPNATHYDEGSLKINGVWVDGRRGEPTYQAARTAMRVPLAEPLPPGAAVRLTIRFTTVIPADSRGTFGVFKHDTAGGTWVLADWYPIVAGYEPAAGWRLDRPTSLGDPTFSDAAIYDVTVAAPSGLTVVATGSEVATRTTASGEVRRRFVTGPVREFTLVADDDYLATSAMAGETLVTIYVNPESGADRGAALALASAVSALAAYSARYGPYPYTRLDLVEIDLTGALGVSWAGLIFLDGPGFLANPFFTQTDPGRLDFTVAHEVGHQWWGNMVGANSNDYLFMVEGLTNYLAIVYVEDTQGMEAARRQLAVQIVQPYLAALAEHGDGVVNRPITAAPEGPPRGALDYGKGAIGFLAIRVAVGDEAFFRALRAYAERFTFRIATPDDLRGAFEAASGADLRPVWRFWFELAEATDDDVNQLLAAA